MATAGACHVKKSARVCGVRKWKSNDDWMVRTGYASAAAISGCAIARHPCDRPQVLPAYGLQDLRNKTARAKNKIKPKYHVPPHHPWRKPWKRTFLSGEKPDISTLR